jgi:hypothetical protein
MSEADSPEWLDRLRAQTGALPLTPSERVVLRDVLAPLISDLAATPAVIPAVGEFQWDLEPDVITAFIGEPHHAQGIRIRVALPAVERLVEVAEQVQEWVIEAHWLGGF